MEIVLDIIQVFSNEATGIGTKSLLVLAIVIFIIFRILLAMKESFEKEYIPAAGTLFALIVVFIGRCIRWFEPGVGTFIQNLALLVVAFGVLICFVFYSIIKIENIFLKLITLTSGAALITHLLSLILIRNIFLFIIVGLVSIRMIMALLEK